MFNYPPLHMAVVCVLLAGIFPFNRIQAQEPSIQDCLGAIPVCQQIYEETNAPIGNGNVFDFVSLDNCTEGENNSIWYTFTVDNSGQFGFLLTPNNPDQDYDWILFDITNADCADIQTDSTLIVSCNAAGKGDCQGPTGATGATEFDNQGPNCGNSPPTVAAGFSPFNDLIDVEAGNTYALCIINFSADLSEGYTLDFGLSSEIGIFDEVPPTLDTVSYPGSCNGALISLQFSEFIQCATISADNFEITGADGPYSLNLTSVNCDAGGAYSKTFNLQIDPPIPFEGAMSLEMTVDGVTEALDLCGNPAQSTSLSFGGPVLTDELDLGPDTTFCTGNSLVLSSSFAGSYFWSDGSNGPSLEVTTSGTYWLTVNTACGPTSDTINVQVLGDGAAADFLGPDTTICANGTVLLDATADGATYLWQDGSTEPTFLADQAGTYSVELTNECGTFSDEISVSTAEPIATILADTAICPGGTVLLDATTSGATYEWQDGSTEATFSVTAAGDYSVMVTTACETVTLNATVSEKTGDMIAVELGNDTTLCAGETLLLAVTATDATISWQDGSSESSFLVDAPDLYSVMISNECGTVEDQITVEYAEPIALTLNDTSICTGETVTFDLSLSDATYLWQDGSTDPIYTVSEPGQYQVTVTNACESVELSAAVSIGGDALPDPDLGEDTVLCPGESLNLSLDIPGVTYSWQDGSTGNSILVDAPGTYSVTISNECGSKSASVNVNAAEPILLNLPADTVLCTGETLILDVTNANATYYQWQDGATESVYTVTQAGVYQVEVGNNCETVTASIAVGSCEVCNVYIPSAFSPNGDGMNDNFQPFLGCQVENVHFSVFNRWGVMVYESNTLEDGWDGTYQGQMVSEGVYIYNLQFDMLENGVSRAASYTGDITVVK